MPVPLSLSRLGHGGLQRLLPWGLCTQPSIVATPASAVTEAGEAMERPQTSKVASPARGGRGCQERCSLFRGKRAPIEGRRHLSEVEGSLALPLPCLVVEEVRGAAARPASTRSAPPERCRPDRAGPYPWITRCPAGRSSPSPPGHTPPPTPPEASSATSRSLLLRAALDSPLHPNARPGRCQTAWWAHPTRARATGAPCKNGVRGLSLFRAKQRNLYPTHAGRHGASQRCAPTHSRGLREAPVRPDSEDYHCFARNRETSTRPASRGTG